MPDRARLILVLLQVYFDLSYTLLARSVEGRRFLRASSPLRGVIVHGYTTPDDLRRLVDALDPGPDRAILDLGSGLGGVAGYVAALTGAQVTGIELSRRAVVTAARTRAPNATTSFRVGSFRRPPRVGAVGAYALDSFMFTRIDADLVRGVRGALSHDATLFSTTLVSGRASADPIVAAALVAGARVLGSEDVTTALRRRSRRRRAIARAILRGRDRGQGTAGPGRERSTVRGRLALLLVIVEESAVIRAVDAGWLRRWRTVIGPGRHSPAEAEPDGAHHAAEVGEQHDRDVVE